ncbi:MAG TPA: HoxN/HupN/NixA family nickel/cobalt transporter [Streptosporangiaceae bacterium]|nr:HoxN/HupN/NixA family nickel/cobalt transporter [Streptosporangiaceae bacterium]
MAAARGTPTAKPAALTTRERGGLAVMAATIAALNLLGWGIFVIAILPHHLRYRGLGIGLGVAITAYTLGVRHAFDADHISAIDNVTRKLMAAGRRPLATGFFFALGHSTIVFAAGTGISIAARAVFGAIVDPRSGFAAVGGIVGTTVSAAFLYLIAILNLAVLAGIVRVLGQLRCGRYEEAELERHLQSRGLMFRFFGRFTGSISRPGQMFFVGMVFGIGFDTATEVLLLAATTAAALQGLPWYAVLALPLLFSAGMTLFDSLDGCFMNFAYGWAFSNVARKVYYNLVITGLSITVAFLVGTIEIAGLLVTELHLRGGFWSFVSGFNINRAGFLIAALFTAVWVAAAAYWRLGNVQKRWSAS